MENSLKLKATEDTPDVLFNKDSNEFRLSGRSLPEDAYAFYSPVIDWMKSYVKSPLPSSELIISLEYFNSSSVKQLLGLITVFEEIVKSGKSAKIIWCYAADDDLMEIKGLEFQSMVDQIPFELKAL